MDQDKIDDLDVEMETVDSTGEAKRASVQTGNRVSIPQNFLITHGADVEDDVYVVCGKDEIHIAFTKERAMERSKDVRNG